MRVEQTPDRLLVIAEDATDRAVIVTLSEIVASALSLGVRIDAPPAASGETPPHS